MNDTAEVKAERIAGLTLRIRIFIAALWLLPVAAVLLGGFFGDLTVESTAALVRSAGAWGIVGYLLAFTLLQPLGFSGHMFTITAALIWDRTVALPLAFAGAVGAALSSYFMARYVAFDWVQARLPQRLRKYESWLVDRGLWGIIGFRMFTFTMRSAMLMMGTIRVRFGTMLAGTIIGFIPQVCIDVLLGGELMRYVLNALGLS